MTIYRMYEENGERAGFWVQHRKWSNACAQVRTIDGRDCGPLPGASPRHNEAAVVVRVFDIRSGRPISDVASDAPAMPVTPAAPPIPGQQFFCDPCDKQYVRIAEPFWHSRKMLRS
jgi:hypothetical protein